MPPEIAVIVCTLDRPLAARDAIGDALAQLPAAAELVVVDQSPDRDALRDALARTDPRLRIAHATPGLPAARNLGLALSSAPVVWFIDDDVRLDPGALAAHLGAYADPRVGGVVGRIDERTVRANARGTTNRVDRAGRVRTNLSGGARSEIETLKGCNMSFRRAALERVGGFDEGFAGTAFLEDADASARVRADGWVLLFEPLASLTHLSAPQGGVRQESAVATERWRFANTARFVRRHRGIGGAPAMIGVFSAIALRRAVEARDLRVGGQLLRALGRGWRGSGH